MPNHCRNTLTVTGPETSLVALQDRFRGEPWDDGEERPVTFEAFVPTPEGIAKTPGLDSLARYVGRDGNSIFRERETVPFEDIPAEELQRIVDGAAAGKRSGFGQTEVPLETMADVRAAYDLLVENRRVHGHSTWYEWAPKNWGTKWDAYETCPTIEAPGSRVFRFQTAWAPPMPVLAVASAAFPDLVFELDWSEEGGNWGKERLRAGGLVAEIEGHIEYLPEPEDCEVESEEYQAWENDRGKSVETGRFGEWSDASE